MMDAESIGLPDSDRRALVAVDLGAESCRVSLLRWTRQADGIVAPTIRLMHRLRNGPVRDSDGRLRWPFQKVMAGLEEGLRLCARSAPEGIRSVAVDGWAVDYIRIDSKGEAQEDPLCYRDERNVVSAEDLHATLSPRRMRAITGIEIQPINTVYQLHADRLANLPESPWLNLPEFCLHHWGAPPVAERTNASHTQLLDLDAAWSPEIFTGAGLDLACAPALVPAGSNLGRMSGPITATPGFAHADLIAPACHDTASAVAGISEMDDDWAYISCGTWSLVGTVLRSPLNSAAVQLDNFTNLRGIGDTICFHKGVNGLWLLKQCMDQWAEDGHPWQLGDLLDAAAKQPAPQHLLEVDEPSLLSVGNMPQKIHALQQTRTLSGVSPRSADAPAMVALLLHSLANRYHQVLDRLQLHTGKTVSAYRDGRRRCAKQHASAAHHQKHPSARCHRPV